MDKILDKIEKDLKSEFNNSLVVAITKRDIENQLFEIIKGVSGKNFSNYKSFGSIDELNSKCPESGFNRIIIHTSDIDITINSKEEIKKNFNITSACLNKKSCYIYICGTYRPYVHSDHSSSKTATPVEITKYLTTWHRMNCDDKSSQPMELLDSWFYPDKIDFENNTDDTYFLLKFTPLRSRFPKAQAQSLLEDVVRKSSLIVDDSLKGLKDILFAKNKSMEEYFKLIVKLLSKFNPDEHGPQTDTDDGLISKMTRALCHQVMSVDNEINWLEFWIAYESYHEGKRIGSNEKILESLKDKAIEAEDIPDPCKSRHFCSHIQDKAIEAEDIPDPLFGFGYRLQMKDEIKEVDLKGIKLKTEIYTIARPWLNIILNSEGYHSLIKDFHLFPKAVHDWFMTHQPFVDYEDRLETLTVYLPTPKNLKRSLHFTAHSTPKHYKIKLLPYIESEVATLFGVQLADTLYKIKSYSNKDDTKLPYWPYDESDEDGLNNIIKAMGRDPKNFNPNISFLFKSETELLERKELKYPTNGWFLINLYSLFLSAVFAKDHKDFKDLESSKWIKFFRDRLVDAGFNDLNIAIENAIKKSRLMFIEINNEDAGLVTALCWVAPPFPPKSDQDRTTTDGNKIKKSGLGSMLVMSSNIIGPAALRWFQPTLRTVLLNVRHGEELLAHEKTNQEKGKFEGLRSADEYFTHEILKHMETIEAFFRPLEHYFYINDLNHSELSDQTPKDKNTDFMYKKPIGNLIVEDSFVNKVSSFLTIDATIVFESFFDQWLLWGKTKSWIQKHELGGVQTLKDAIEKILKAIISGGIFRIYTKKEDPPNSIDALDSLILNIKDKEDKQYNILNKFIGDDIEDLEWKISDDKKTEWLLKMLSAAILNLLEHSDDLDPKSILIIKIKDNSELEFKISNNVVEEENAKEFDENQLRTKGILESGIMEFQKNPDKEEDLFFNYDNTNNQKWLTRFTLPFQSFAKFKKG